MQNMWDAYHALMNELLAALFRAVLSLRSVVTNSELVSVTNMAIAVVIAAAVLLWRTPANRGKGNLRHRLFPAKVWRHPSALLDVKFYVVIQALRAAILVPALLIITVGLSYKVLAGLEYFAGPRWPGSTGANSWGTIGLYTLLVFLAQDFAFFASHLLQHKWKWLWCFHKVHHSATVLVPFTAMRFHPLDTFWNMIWGAGLVGVMSGVCQYFFYNGESEWRLFGNNLVVALSFLTTHNLRHSHVWLHYPHRIANWLLSPAQHQIHHSLAPEHVDKNLGYLFAAWDRMFGTLVNPTEKLDLKVGVEGMPESGPLAHDSVKGILLAPFRELFGGHGGKQGTDASGTGKPAIRAESADPNRTA